MKMPYITDYIYVSRGCIHPEICQKIIEENRNLDETWHQHTWTSPDLENGGLKTSSRSEQELAVKLTDEETSKVLIQSLTTALDEYTAHLGNGRELYTRLSHPRINRYSVGTNMAEHIDIISSLFGEGVGSPNLSLVGVLNDNYVGGEFVMFDQTEIQLRTGDVLVFPSTFLYPHKVNTVTEGERWSFVSWAF